MAEREADHTAAGRDSALRAIQSHAFLVGVGVCFVLSLIFAAEAFRGFNNPATGRLNERINPNEAPIASLMRLPQVGVARARAIVAHRDLVGTQAGRPPVFQEPDDLQQIKGIGPSIVEGLRPWLQFDDLPEDGNDSSKK